MLSSFLCYHIYGLSYENRDSSLALGLEIEQTFQTTLFQDHSNSSDGETNPPRVQLDSPSVLGQVWGSKQQVIIRLFLLLCINLLWGSCKEAYLSGPLKVGFFFTHIIKHHHIIFQISPWPLIVVLSTKIGNVVKWIIPVMGGNGNGSKCPFEMPVDISGAAQ